MRIFIISVSLLAVIAFSTAATCAPKAATPENQICQSLQNTIDNAQKDASVAAADEIVETSAPRATVQEGKISAAYLEIQTNLILMGQHHCAPLNKPISTVWYLTNAMTCKADKAQAALAGKKDLPDSCDRSKWKNVGK